LSLRLAGPADRLAEDRAMAKEEVAVRRLTLIVTTIGVTSNDSSQHR
jgi:hypothetical protein